MINRKNDAIVILKKLRKSIENDTNKEEEVEAIDFAIKVIDQYGYLVTLD